MARLIDYRVVLETLTAAGFRSLYHNAGAFGFAPEAKIHIRGWIGQADSTIRPEMLATARQMPPAAMAKAAAGIWSSHLGSECWLMPKSHWHYELHFGNPIVLAEMLNDLGIDVATLRDRNDGSAIAFSSDEIDSFTTALARLLKELRGSDFLLVFPQRATLCTVHHHQQLWWETLEAQIASAIESIDPV